MDTGTAYRLPEPRYDADLVRVGPRTPGGEMLRRYWHPIALSTEAGDVPRKVRVLGEDLILFRDGRGRPGPVYPPCCPRGTTPHYGKGERDGIRRSFTGCDCAPRGPCGGTAPTARDT